jgi:hypothetical protein
MRWDLGPQGLALLVAMSLAFGVIAQIIGRTVTRWMWLIATPVFFAMGLFISEVWFGWATEEELQPNIDGLSFDEVLLGLIPGIAALLITRYMVRRNRRRSAGAASRPQRAQHREADGTGRGDGERVPCQADAPAGTVERRVRYTSDGGSGE